MKKYTDDYFEKKYKILSDKLLKREGFFDDIKAARKELDLPVEGFTNTQELAEFFIKKLTKAQQQSLTLRAFISLYEIEHKKRIAEEDREDFLNTFMKKFKTGIGMIPMMFELSDIIETHHYLISKCPILEGNKHLSKLFPKVLELMSRYWGVDLLDDHIILHYIEKYLLLGQVGINQYIKSKVACHNCRYLGVDHFSPDGRDMEGRDEGPYSGKYIFNEAFVKRLSAHFNSVFLVIKPYATKELVIQYIEDNWDDLKEHIIEKNTFYKQFNVHPSIIKESDDEKNRLVYELNKLSKKELIKAYKGKKDFSPKGIYTESIVSAILDEEYQIKMSPDAVKKAATRFAKSINAQKAPKDIRDI
jgi:hypothetical protein